MRLQNNGKSRGQGRRSRRGWELPLFPPHRGHSTLRHWPHLRMEISSPSVVSVVHPCLPSRRSSFRPPQAPSARENGALLHVSSPASGSRTLRNTPLIPYMCPAGTVYIVHLEPQTTAGEAGGPGLGSCPHLKESTLAGAEEAGGRGGSNLTAPCPGRLSPVNWKPIRCFEHCMFESDETGPVSFIIRACSLLTPLPTPQPRVSQLCPGRGSCHPLGSAGLGGWHWRAWGEGEERQKTETKQTALLGGGNEPHAEWSLAGTVNAAQQAQPPSGASVPVCSHTHTYTYGHTSTHVHTNIHTNTHVHAPASSEHTNRYTQCICWDQLAPRTAAFLLSPQGTGPSPRLSPHSPSPDPVAAKLRLVVKVKSEESPCEEWGMVVGLEAQASGCL